LVVEFLATRLLTRQITDSEHCLAKPDTPIHISAADPNLVLTTLRARNLTQATSAALRKHFGIGVNGKGKDICSVISTGHYLLPVLSYGVIGAGGVFSAASAASTASELSKQLQGAKSKILITCEATKDTSVKAAEEAGWGANGGGRVLLMSEGRDWELKVIGKDGQLGRNLIDESDKLPWQKITDPFDLENSLVILIYSSGTTGLPKGKYTRLEMSQRPTLTTYRRQAISSQSCS
jgi:4-coumarate--CoA ligase